MKKSIILTLALVFVLGIAGTAFAANPFVDVPAKHWAYDAVAKLAQAGIVDGYGDGTFKGDKTMTRYEMAQVVAKAMARSDKADAEQKAMIDKLSVEFSTELNNMGVRVAKLEKKAAADSVNITGYARIRYENRTFDQNEVGSSPLSMRSRLFVTGQINDQWNYAGRLETNYDLRSGSTSDQGVELNNAWVTGPVAGTKATFGRFDYVPVNGMMMDSTLNGAKFSFGNVLKTNVYYGKHYDGSTADNKDADWLTNNDTVTAVELSYAASKELTLKGAYYHVNNNVNGKYFSIPAVAGDLGRVGKDNINAWELAFDYALSKDWMLKGNYAKTNAQDENRAWMAQICYKGVDKAKVNSFGAYLQYRDLQSFATLDTTYDAAFASNYQTANGTSWGRYAGGKGYEVGFKYVPMQNTIFTTFYSDIKSTVSGMDNVKSKYYQAKFEFWF